MRGVINFLSQYAAGLAASLLFPGYPTSELNAAFMYREAIVPLTIDAEIKILNITEPKDQYELTGLFSNFYNVSQSAVVGAQNITTTYDIATFLYVPNSFQQNGTVELLLHGLDADHRYWDFGGRGSKYNYVDAALASGHAVLLYDRLGVGKSAKPSGLEVQLATDVAVAAGLVDHLRKGVSGYSFGSVVAVAHSFGSSTLNNLLAQKGDLVDAAIITGFTPFLAGMGFAPYGLNPQVASLFDPKSFGSLDHYYVISGNKWTDMMAFFSYTGFEKDVFEAYFAGRGTETLGELLTLAVTEAPAYTGPILIINPDHDLTFCNGNCHQPLNGKKDLNEATLELFPNRRRGDTHMVGNTGHIMNMHLSAPGGYEVMQKWIAEVLA
ncbi:alpha/beta-hydrolase [Gloeophyllum trabeum ATCC 11539]|uniref:Alpha/beta-hydrolase n=1 Tax=Gloeophyllum trabeum (strain ATCC 11539 / FP-39264 / Madison 617) TaxID=670483 RepID=S7R7B7_GLOTA|nr:alpha/beta-hydrolase [Gloeophyllum trabeum ATCC 11539]EPQ50280.1 alpha/beta-hydrolase [Gloeophyllum trabeum ATCC 11539]